MSAQTSCDKNARDPEIDQDSFPPSTANAALPAQDDDNGIVNNVSIWDPWDFDEYELGHFLIRDKYFLGFDKALKEFYRPLSSESDYRHVQYSVTTFKSVSAMSRFLSRVREMRPAVSDSRPVQDGPLAYFHFYGNSVAIRESRWPYRELKQALAKMRISCTVAVYHQVRMKFANERVERHFRSDCTENGVKFDDSMSRAPKFLLGTSTPVDPTIAEGIYFDKANQKWLPTITYDGFEFRLGSFDERDDAVDACCQFQYLVSQIGAALD
jgi:hypothetical protein